MHVIALSTTYERDTCLQRLLRSFIEQVISPEHRATLVVFNSGTPTTFPPIELPDNKEIILINRTTNLEGQPFTSVGDKYNTAISLCPIGDIETSMDCDDLFLPNHLQEGIEGMQRAYSEGKMAYKPKYSYFKGAKGVSLQENVFEPSIFVDFQWVKEKGYFPNSVKFHDCWLLPLIYEGKILVDPKGKPTFAYDWSGELKVYKMSGRPDTPENFTMSQAVQGDSGTGITIPMSKERYEKYVKQIEDSCNGLL